MIFFRKIALILQKQSIDLQDVFKYPLGAIPYALPDVIGIMVKSKKVDLLFELEKGSLCGSVV